MGDEGLKVITYKELRGKLKRLGFIEIRTSKHPVYFNEERNITIPLPSHPGDVPKGLLRKIIKEIGISVKEFNAV